VFGVELCWAGSNVRDGTIALLKSFATKLEVPWESAALAAVAAESFRCVVSQGACAHDGGVGIITSTSKL